MINTLVHEAVEEACKRNPQLVLEPYYQMKAAALILAEKILQPPSDDLIREAELVIKWVEGSTSVDIIPPYIREYILNHEYATITARRDQ